MDYSLGREILAKAKTEEMVDMLLSGLNPELLLSTVKPGHPPSEAMARRLASKANVGLMSGLIASLTSETLIEDLMRKERRKAVKIVAASNPNSPTALVVEILMDSNLLKRAQAVSILETMPESKLAEFAQFEFESNYHGNFMKYLLTLRLVELGTPAAYDHLKTLVGEDDALVLIASSNNAETMQILLEELKTSERDWVRSMSWETLLNLLRNAFNISPEEGVRLALLSMERLDARTLVNQIESTERPAWVGTQILAGLNDSNKRKFLKAFPPLEVVNMATFRDMASDDLAFVKLALRNISVIDEETIAFLLERYMRNRFYIAPDDVTQLIKKIDNIEEFVIKNPHSFYFTMGERINNNDLFMKLLTSGASANHLAKAGMKFHASAWEDKLITKEFVQKVSQVFSYEEWLTPCSEEIALKLAPLVSPSEIKVFLTDTDKTRSSAFLLDLINIEKLEETARCHIFEHWLIKAGESAAELKFFEENALELILSELKTLRAGSLVDDTVAPEVRELIIMSMPLKSAKAFGYGNLRPLIAEAVLNHVDEDLSKLRTVMTLSEAWEGSLNDLIRASKVL